MVTLHNNSSTLSQFFYSFEGAVTGTAFAVLISTYFELHKKCPLKIANFFETHKSSIQALAALSGAAAITAGVYRVFHPPSDDIPRTVEAIFDKRGSFPHIKHPAPELFQEKLAKLRLKITDRDRLLASWKHEIALWTYCSLGICLSADIDWSGKKITSEELVQKKQREMLRYCHSLKRYAYEKLKPSKPLDKPVCKTEVCNQDTLECAYEIQKAYPQAQVVVVNLANAYTPGGAYFHGYGYVQEETLFKISSSPCMLASNLVKEGPSYKTPLTPNSNYYYDLRYLLPNLIEGKDQGIEFGCIALAAPDLRSQRVQKEYVTEGKLNTKYTEIQKQLFRLFLRTALKKKESNKKLHLVYGAPGSGAFAGGFEKQILEVLPKACYDVLCESEFKDQIEEVKFAILENPAHAKKTSAFKNRGL